MSVNRALTAASDLVQSVTAFFVMRVCLPKDHKIIYEMLPTYNIANLNSDH